jgi:hypothetical protein
MEHASKLWIRARHAKRLARSRHTAVGRVFTANGLRAGRSGEASRLAELLGEEIRR